MFLVRPTSLLGQFILRYAHSVKKLGLLEASTEKRRVIGGRRLPLLYRCQRLEPSSEEKLEEESTIRRRAYSRPCSLLRESGIVPVLEIFPWTYSRQDFDDERVGLLRRQVSKREEEGERP